MKNSTPDYEIKILNVESCSYSFLVLLVSICIMINPIKVN